jgi:hypothetical protein
MHLFTKRRSGCKILLTAIIAIGIALLLFKSGRFGEAASHPRVIPSKEELMEMHLTLDWSFVTEDSKLLSCKLDSSDRTLRLHEAEFSLDPLKIFDLKREMLNSIYSEMPRGPVVVNGGRPQYITIYCGDWPFGVSKNLDPRHYAAATLPLKKLLKALAVDVAESVE